MQSDKPVLIEGGLSVDDRGILAFCNDFKFDDVKRFYIVQNHRSGFIRAWHGHKHEVKYVTAVAGAALVCVVPLGGALVDVRRFTLFANKPAVLYIPPGYANGWMSLTPDCRLLFLSTATLKESAQDDIRFPTYHWDLWSVEER